MLQNAYFLAKIGADTAENEQHFAGILPKTGNYPTTLRSAGGPGRTANPTRSGRRRAVALSGPGSPPPMLGLVSKISKNSKIENWQFRNFYAKFCKFLAGSFSAVSKRNFARK